MKSLDHLKSLSEMPFSFENQFKKSTAVVFQPAQANSSITQVDDKTTGGKRQITWFQLVGMFKTNYTANAETGEVLPDNSTVKTLIVKFSPATAEGVSASRFKSFFDTHFVGKRSIILPISSESEKVEFKDGKRIPIKNTFEAQVDPDFKLIDLINEIEGKSK
jgi:hypothetical protein